MGSDASDEGVVDRVLGLLDRAKKTSTGWVARCPAHEDEHPSLSLAVADDGGVLVHCFKGCAREQIVRALGLNERDLQPRRSARPTLAGTQRRADVAGHRNGFAVGGVTLDQLAAAKFLPIELLKHLGCVDYRGSSVRIPYYNTDGNQVATRTRLALTGDRFRWGKGDHPVPYGLWRLEEARHAGWLLLVEGETDCWTLWHHGIPALGIPGKGTWRADWAEFLHDLEVVLWQEPDAEDLVDRVNRDLPQLRVIVAPPGTKDVSDAHVRGEDVVALVDRFKAEAVAAQDLLERRSRERRVVAREAAQPVLAHPDPLDLIEAEIRAQGYGGDLRGPMLCYLAATSRVLAPRRGSVLPHLLFVGPSSGGKNAAMQAALRLFPDEAIHVIDAGSPRVLIYDDAPLEHRVVVFSEADSLPAGEDNPAASAIRNLLQDGRLHYKVTVRDPATGDFAVRNVDKPGPTVLMTTSTRPLGQQLMTRLFTVEIPDEPAHVRAALAAQAALELDEPPPVDQSLVDFQRYLGSLAPRDVVVPFADTLQGFLGKDPGGPRVLRDYPRLLSLIKAVAVLRSAQRTHDSRGRLVAVIADYRVVHRLVADSYEASAGASARVRDAVAAVREIAEAKGADATVTKSEVATRLGISDASAWRRVRDAIANQWLVNDEQRKSQRAKLRLGEPLPEASSLPTPEALSELYALNPKRVHSGVFTFSGHADASPPSTNPGSEQGGGHSTVNAETAKTPGDDREDVPTSLPFNLGFFGDEEEWGMGTV